MLSVDDLLDDAHWRNVQDPVKQMFLSLSKALRVQAASVRDIDKKCADHLTADQVSRMIRDSFDLACTKQDATQLIYQLESKVSEKQLSSTDARLDMALQQIENLQSQLSSQTTTISALSARLEQCTHELSVLKNPNYDNIFSYIDRQLNNLTTDVDNKLQGKADRRDVENALPQRLEDLYRNIYSKFQDLKLDVSRCVTKEAMIELANTKADVSVIRDLSSDLNDRVTRHESHQTILQNLKPLLQTVTSMEKQLQVQDGLLKNTQRDWNERLVSIQSVHQEIVNSQLLPLLRAHPNTNFLAQSSTEHIESVVYRFLQDRHLQDLSGASIQTLVSTQLEGMMKQVSLLCESMRLEVISTCREEFNQGKAVMQNKVDEAVHTSAQCMEKLHRTRQGIKELSLNSAKALSKKLDRKEFYRAEGAATTSAQQLYRKSRELLPTQLSGGESTQEFDYLMNAIRHSNQHPNSDTSSEHEGDWEEERKEAGIAGERSSPPRSKSSRRRTPSPRPSPHRATRRGTPSSAATSAALHKIIQELRTQLAGVSAEVTQLREQVSRCSQCAPSANATPPAAPVSCQQVVLQQEVDRLDWRLALGDLGLNLRREMADKISREEVYTALHSEAASAEKRLSALEQSLEGAAKGQDLLKVENDLLSLKARVSGELTGARFLWTSGQLLSSSDSVSQALHGNAHTGFVPWDAQVVNSAPSIYIWRKGAAQITVRVPGLYRLSVCMFTTERAAIHVYLNDEPLFVYQPSPYSSSSSPVPNHPNSPSQGPFQPPYSLRKLAHSAGEVTCIGLDEHVSLPAEAALKILYTSHQPAQGFFSLKKL